MQFSMSASGTPAEVRESINQQAKTVARDAAQWPAAAAVRDYVANSLAGVPAEQTVSVSVAMQVTITGAEKPEPAGKVTTVATGTVGVDGPAVAVVGEDRVITVGDTEYVEGVSSAPAVSPAEAERFNAIAGDSSAIGRRSSDRRK